MAVFNSYVSYSLQKNTAHDLEWVQRSSPTLRHWLGGAESALCSGGLAHFLSCQQASIVAPWYIRLKEDHFYIIIRIWARTKNVFQWGKTVMLNPEHWESHGPHQARCELPQFCRSKRWTAWRHNVGHDLYGHQNVSTWTYIVGTCLNMFLVGSTTMTVQSLLQSGAP